MNAIGDWLNESEPVIRNAFRCVVIILLLVVIFRTEESISTADAAHDQAYESREFATIAAHDANNASDNAADAASACKQILYR